MSNRAFATRYDGGSSAPRSSGGGADLFGLQAKRQKDVMMLQQAQELEKMREAERLSEQGAKQEGDISKEKGRFDAAVGILKQNGMIPTDANIKSYDDATTQQRLQIAKTENDIEQAQSTSKLNFLQSKPGQTGMNDANAAILAKPGVDNNEARARAQALSTTTVPPNTLTRVGAPGGEFGKPQDFRGENQTTQMVGGMKMPDGSTFGGKPVETYSGGSFPPVGKINLGDSQNLTNNVQATPNATPMQNTFQSMGGTFATQPPTGGTPDLLTKPAQSQANPFAGDPLELIKMLMQHVMKQGPNRPVPTSSDALSSLL